MIHRPQEQAADMVMTREKSRVDSVIACSERYTGTGMSGERMWRTSLASSADNRP